MLTWVLEYDSAVEVGAELGAKVGIVGARVNVGTLVVGAHEGFAVAGAALIFVGEGVGLAVGFCVDASGTTGVTDLPTAYLNRLALALGKVPYRMSSVVRSA